MTTRRKPPAPVLGVVLALALAPVAGAQDSLATARDLYASAAYEEALTLLNRLKDGGSLPPVELQGVAQYRAFCLLALGRTAEAERTIEDIVTADPMYQPDEAETSPRLLAAVRHVRRRLLPAIVQEKYAMAKATFERKEHAAAVDQFKRVLSLLDDPQLEGASNDPSIPDIRTLAAGFLDLSVAALAPPPAVELPPASPALVLPRIYQEFDAGVTPPVALRQDVPRWPVALAPPTASSNYCVIEVVVKETGEVQSAVIRHSLNRMYDEMVLNAAKSWRYRPAVKEGEPVKFLKRIRISVDAR